MEKYFNFRAEPKTFWLTVNRACNFRCRWCYAKDTGYHQSDEMTLDVAKEVVDLAKSADASHVVLVGGEPTLWPHLTEFNQYCAANGINSGLSTNAYLFGNDSYWEQYSQAPSNSVNVSIKGVTKKHFVDLVAAPKSRQQTLLGMQRILSSCNDACASTVLSNLVNVEDVIDIARTAKKCGAKYFRLTLCTATLSQTGASAQFMPDLTETSKNVMELHPILDQLFNGEIVFELNLPLCLWPTSFIDELFERHQILSLCHVQDRSGLVFDINGDVLPCNGMINAHIARRGLDFSSYDELIAHLNSADMQNDYSNLLRLPAPCCDSCKYNDRCHGGCLLNWTVLDPKICKPIS